MTFTESVTIIWSASECSNILNAARQAPVWITESSPLRKVLFCVQTRPGFDIIGFYSFFLLCTPPPSHPPLSSQRYTHFYYFLWLKWLMYSKIVLHREMNLVWTREARGSRGDIRSAPQVNEAIRSARKAHCGGWCYHQKNKEHNAPKWLWKLNKGKLKIQGFLMFLLYLVAKLNASPEPCVAAEQNAAAVL